MKNITKTLIALFAIVAFSCTQDEVQDRPVIVSKDAPVLTAPTAGTIYVLTPENATTTAERFTWNSANFGGNVEVTYAVQMEIKGGDFSAPQTLASVVSANQVAVTVEVMNGAALKLKATPFVAADFEIRVIATSGTSMSIVSATTTAIVVKPYTTEAPKLWIPGGYQAASGYGSTWTHATAPQLASSGYGKTDFEGYVYFGIAQDATLPDQGFKLSDQAGWGGNNYGIGASAGKLDPKGGNLSITPAGYYLVKADTDLTKLTYSTTVTTWGVVGSATPAGWPDSDSSTVDNDSMMTYNKDTKTWTVTVPLTAGAIKFRPNKDWAINYGDDKVDNVLDAAGADIVIAAPGTYVITLNFSSPRHYIYTAVKQ